MKPNNILRSALAPLWLVGCLLVMAPLSHAAIHEVRDGDSDKNLGVCVRIGCGASNIGIIVIQKCEVFCFKIITTFRHFEN